MLRICSSSVRTAFRTADMRKASQRLRRAALPLAFGLTGINVWKTHPVPTPCCTVASGPESADNVKPEENLPVFSPAVRLKYLNESNEQVFSDQHRTLLPPTALPGWHVLRRPGQCSAHLLASFCGLCLTERSSLSTGLPLLGDVHPG